MEQPFDMQAWLYKQWKESKGIDEDKQPLTEEYIEVMNMPVLAAALFKIEKEWNDWKNGPLTEKSDIKPAKKELLNYINGYLKKAIK